MCQRAQRVGDGVGRMSHRVRAAEISPISRCGLGSRPTAPPLAAASWSRRVWAMRSRLPSPTTTATAGQRRAVSIAHTRSSGPGGSTKTERASRSPSISTHGFGQQHRPIQNTHPGPAPSTRRTRWTSTLRGGVHPWRSPASSWNHSWIAPRARAGPNPVGRGGGGRVIGPCGRCSIRSIASRRQCRRSPIGSALSRVRGCGGVCNRIVLG